MLKNAPMFKRIDPKMKVSLRASMQMGGGNLSHANFLAVVVYQWLLLYSSAGVHMQMKNVPMGVGGRGRAVAARAKAKAGAAPGRGQG